MRKIALVAMMALMMVSVGQTRPAAAPDALAAAHQKIAAQEKQIAELQRQIMDLKAAMKAAGLAEPSRVQSRTAATKGIGRVLKVGSEGRAFVLEVERVIDAHTAILKVAGSPDGRGFENDSVSVYVTGIDTTGMTTDPQEGAELPKDAGWRTLKITGTKSNGIRTILSGEEVHE